MSKWMMTVCAFLTSAAAFASTPNFAVLDQGGNDGMGKCIEAAWNATQPTDDQNKQAGAFCADAKTVVDAHKDALHADFKAMMDAWAKSPISHDDVVAAETAIHGEIAPVHVAVRDATISILNLLTADQRSVFDAAAKDCFHHGQ